MCGSYYMYGGNAYNFVGKSDRKKTIARPRCVNNNYNKMLNKEIGFEDVEWVQLAQDSAKR